MKAISVENVGKRFTLSHTRPRNLADGLRGYVRRAEREAFWALKDVSFAVEQGEALGIIGHNGAGKSTMLKLLTHIMEPTEGRIRTRGRVSALIEIGAGFHPEMTGRENTYLNGSILGMSRREIDKKFDAIVAFAELEKFIDTPVKRYSSGMYARLGFSVAAHVDPEILLVDEVLSVGDAAFQERCAERMRSMRNAHATIVFVSHNLGAVIALCDRVVLLNHGRVVDILPPVDAVRLYRRLALENASASAGDSDKADARRTDSIFAITDLEALSHPTWEVNSGDTVRFKVRFSARGAVSRPRIGLRFTGSLGTVVARTGTGDKDQSRDVSGEGQVDVLIPSLPLLPDRYFVQTLAADTHGVTMYDTGTVGHELLVMPPDSAKLDLSPGGDRGFAWVDANWLWPDAS